ncbi:MAG TPA: spore coat protein CotJB [Clostridium sp.]|nr:spore coat protein CotJB [Clostridium sp.]
MDLEKLTYEIQKLQFAAVELNLYLDNFPNNKKAKEDYQQVSKKLNELIKEYEICYGPLKNLGAAYIQNPEKWVNQPWPWELCD